MVISDVDANYHRLVRLGIRVPRDCWAETAAEKARWNPLRSDFG